MFAQVTDIFVDIDDFCKNFHPFWQKYLLSSGNKSTRGPKPCLSDSEIITIVILYQLPKITNGIGCRFYFKNIIEKTLMYSTYLRFLRCILGMKDVELNR